MAKIPKQVNHGLNFQQSISAPGMWQFPTNHKHCCIYRVPDRLREINPKAYTPQLVILGPLHHSLKSQALNSPGDIGNTKLMGYLNMEQHKKIYLSALQQRFVEDDNIDQGEEIIDGFKRVIKEEEEVIRASYSESTIWIKSTDFVEMILHDSVFILEFILRRFEDIKSTGDILMDEPCLYNTVYDDLILLENQFPFFILQKLFDPVIKTLYGDATLTLRKLIMDYFGLMGMGKINDNSDFKHFTDLLRCVHVDSLMLEGEVSGPKQYKPMHDMCSAKKLHGGGIKFKVIEEVFSLNVKFENGCLELPILFQRSP